MKKIIIMLVMLLPMFAITAKDLLTERKGFKTELIKKEKLDNTLEVPPKELFKIIKFKTKIGEMPAYLSIHKVLKSGKRSAIIWLTGGLPGSTPSGYLWGKQNTSNDQSARIYRQSGIVTMYPVLRGRGKGIPGVVESFYGEIEDVISAAKYLKSLDYIDPKRIYLGGHSTGGTLSLLVSESTGIFAGVISLGPVSDHYGQENSPYKWTKKEIYLRSSKNFLSYIKSPTYIIEGVTGNIDSIIEFKEILKKKPNLNIKIAQVKNASHFSCIHPVNQIFAKAIIESKNGLLKLDFKNKIENAYDEFIK